MTAPMLSSTGNGNWVAAGVVTNPIGEVVDDASFGIHGTHLTTGAIDIAYRCFDALRQFGEIGVLRQIKGPARPSTVAYDDNPDHWARFPRPLHPLKPLFDLNHHGTPSFPGKVSRCHSTTCAVNGVVFGVRGAARVPSVRTAVRIARVSR
jgi:hypothetical protein